MDQEQLVKKFLREALLPKPRLDQDQNILEELLNFYEIFEGSKHLPQLSRGSAGMFHFILDILLLEYFV